MPEYAGKSAEELRWEDYQDGVKGGPGTPSTGGTSLFGSPSPFGGAAPAASPSPFGAPQSTPGFGAPQQQAAPAFGGFGAASTPAFGAPQSQPAFGFGGASAASPFGGMSTPAFGQSSSPAFGAASTPAFGAASTPAFGAAPTPAFGAPQSTPAFGFGGSSTPAFGAPQQQSSPAFGGFGAASAPAFGAAPAAAPAFGASSSPFSFGGTSAPAFGAPASSASLFGASSASLFGATSAPAFGAAPAPSLFGAKPATGGFSFASPASTPAFGATATTPAPAFGATPTPGLFGTPQTSAPAFSFASQPAASNPSFALVPAGQQQPQLGQQYQQAVSPSVGASPYGSLPHPPTLTPLPEYRVGLTQQQRHPLAPLSGGPPRPVALITPRSLTPRSGTGLRARQGVGSVSSLSRLSRSSPGDVLFTGGSGAGTPGSIGVGNGGPSPSVFVARDDPRRLFVREPLPSTEGASGVSPSPMRGRVSLGYIVYCMVACSGIPA
jgi:Spt5 C-terminal nonapeptide repeat binding Spt4